MLCFIFVFLPIEVKERYLVYFFFCVKAVLEKIFNSFYTEQMFVHRETFQYAC